MKRNTKSENGITRQTSKALQVTENFSFCSKYRGHVLLFLEETAPLAAAGCREQCADRSRQTSEEVASLIDTDINSSNHGGSSGTGDH